MKHLVCVSVWIRIHAHIHSTHSASIRIRENLLWIPQLHRFVTFAAVAICKQLPSARQRPQHSKTGKTRHHFNGYTSGHDLKEEEKKIQTALEQQKTTHACTSHTRSRRVNERERAEDGMQLERKAASRGWEMASENHVKLVFHRMNYTTQSANCVSGVCAIFQTEDTWSLLWILFIV